MLNPMLYMQTMRDRKEHIFCYFNESRSKERKDAEKHKIFRAI